MKTMANIQPRYSKDGKLISYSVRVHRGRGQDGKQLKPWTATFEVSPTWTEKSAKKKAEASQDADMSQDSGGKEEAV